MLASVKNVKEKITRASSPHEQATIPAAVAQQDEAPGKGVEMAREGVVDGGNAGVLGRDGTDDVDQGKTEG